MARPLRQLAVLLFFVSNISAQSPPPRFMGREVTIIEPEVDADGFFPKGPASVCVNGPQQQCYTAPKDFGRSPAVTVVQLEKDVPALLFSAASGGVSGFQIHFALLRPGTGKDLQNLFISDMELANQNQHAFWTDLSISDAKIFVTAEYIWGPEEGHYGKHRYIISAFVRRSSSILDDRFYYLDDRYMTAHNYDLGANADILGSEKQDIITRLRRVKRERPH
jgi:hypothetical protein